MKCRWVLAFVVKHYYSYGLKISTLSSNKIPNSYDQSLKNGYLFNGKELIADADLNWYDYGYRYYDPQIARFPQLDPLSTDYPYYTPYQFAGCEPVANVDLDGLEPSNVVNFVTALGQQGAVNITDKVIAAGRYAGYWSVSWAKNGILFSKVFTSTGFLTRQVIGAASQIAKVGLNLANQIANGDLSSHFNIKTQEHQAFRSYADAVASWNYAAEHDWHKIKVGRNWVEGGEVNHTTGERRPNPTNINSVNWELAVMPGPKIGLLSKLGRAARSTAFESFTKNNFRANLGKLTEYVPVNSHAHHIFPQKFQSFFKRHGINIHDPKFGAWWEKSVHLKNAAGYNAKWADFIRLNPNATQSPILNQGRTIMQQYGIPIGF